MTKRVSGVESCMNEYPEGVRDAFVPGAILSETDTEGRISYVNARLTEVSQYTSDELVGKLDNVIVNPDLPDELLVRINRVITAGRIFSGVMKEQTRDGRHIWVDATIIPIKNKAGEITRYVNARYPILDDVMGEYLYNKQAEKLGIS